MVVSITDYPHVCDQYTIYTECIHNFVPVYTLQDLVPVYTIEDLVPVYTIHNLAPVYTIQNLVLVYTIEDSVPLDITHTSTHIYSRRQSDKQS